MFVSSPSSGKSDPQVRSTNRDILETSAFFALLALTFALAIPFGSVDPWAKAIFVVAAAVIGLLRTLSGFVGGGFRVSSPVLLLPLVCITFLAILQILPISAAAGFTSLDPYETKSFAIVFAALIVCYEAFLTLTNSSKRLKGLVAAVLGVAFASSIFGIIREGIGWELLTQQAPGEQSFAQFINRNHFATLAEMALGLLVGILLKADLTTRVRFAGWLGAVLLFYSIIESSSRGGILSATGLVLFGVFVHALTITKRERSKSRSGRRAAETAPLVVYAKRVALAFGLCVFLFGVMAVVVAFVGGDGIVTRFERIERETKSPEGSLVTRPVIWNSTLGLIRSRPVTGSGFGAYEAAITKFDLSNGEFRLSQAHNDYLEILAAGGLVGFALFVIFVTLVTSRIVATLRSQDIFRRACCFGAALGIIGVLIHAVVDFGLHTLINAYVLVIILTIATAKIPATSGEHSLR